MPPLNLAGCKVSALIPEYVKNVWELGVDGGGCPSALFVPLEGSVTP